MKVVCSVCNADTWPSKLDPRAPAATPMCRGCGRDRMGETRGRPALDLVGRRFGMLVVVRRGEQRLGSGNFLWICRCDCGREIVERAGHLMPPARSGRKPRTSCGCARRGERRYLGHGWAVRHGTDDGLWMVSGAAPSWAERPQRTVVGSRELAAAQAANAHPPGEPKGRVVRVIYWGRA